ncbi:MAG: cytochrome c oxidase assembly protein [Rhodospirillaceae bacterium]
MKLRTSKGTTVLGLVLILGVMAGLTSYSPTLYRLFCDFTGYGGTTQRASSGSDRIIDRKITVRFNADVNQELDWKFAPLQKEITLKVGEKGLAFYHAQSLASEPVSGTASFNVTPAKAGVYFVKMECFCFSEQVLKPGESIDMPVQFYIDPELASDKNLSEIDTITLSYTFFRSARENQGRAGQTARADGVTDTSRQSKIN